MYSISLRGIANPYGAIGSAALVLRHSLGLATEAAAVERAVAEAIEVGVRTPDIAPRTGATATTQAAGDAVLDRI